MDDFRADEADAFFDWKVFQRRARTAAILVAALAMLLATLLRNLNDSFESRLSQIRPGMSMEEVHDLLGPPTSVREELHIEPPELRRLADATGASFGRWLYERPTGDDVPKQDFLVFFKSDQVVGLPKVRFRPQDEESPNKEKQ